MAKKKQEESSRRNWNRFVPPPGVNLLRTLRGHTAVIGRIAWSPDGRTLVSPSEDRTVRFWDFETGECVRTLPEYRSLVSSVAFDPDGRILASGGWDRTIKLWASASGELLRTLTGHADRIWGLSWSPDGKTLASTSKDSVLSIWDTKTGQRIHALHSNQLSFNDPVWSRDGTLVASADVTSSIRLWLAAKGKVVQELRAHKEEIHSIVFDPQGVTLASGGTDGVVNLWEIPSGHLLRSLEGHTDRVNCISFSFDGRLVASKGGDDTVRLWRSDTGASLGIISEPSSSFFASSLVFHPRLPILATVGSDPDTPPDERDRVIHIWELDLTVLFGQVAEPSAQYVNAKVVLVGDTGVGKSGLSLVLINQPFEATDSTPGRRVWTFDSRDVPVGNDVTQTRETLLWDLAGQPGYRVIHQLHLNEVAVALVVFDARSETDPLAGVRHWERALRLAHQRQGSSAVQMKKFLVSARNDRGGVSIGEDRLQKILEEFGFDGYFKTSAKEGWQIKELRAAIENAISWKNLPEVSSSQLFADIKSFLLDVKKTGLLLAPALQLYDEFTCQHPDTAAKVANLRGQFFTCIGRLENRDLIRRLTFGGYILLQPELLDAYASSMVNTAKEEPDGLGSLAEEIALAGKFFVPEDQKIADAGQAQLLLHATVEELVRHDVALRENADDGSYLVFPSQFNRDYEDAPEPKGKAVAITFDGPVQSLYSTLAVRLGHSGLFTTGRAEMWRNAAVFTARAGGKCGLYLHEFAEAMGRLVIFYDQHEGRLPSDETRFHFEEFVLAHAQRRAIDGTVNFVRFFVCANGHPVPDDYVRLLSDQGKKQFDCPCGAKVSLAEPKERLHFASQVDAMEQSADRQRNFEMFVESARGETSTPSFTAWAGDERVTLAIVFTDVVGSTGLGEEIKDERMSEVRNAHFAQSRKLIEQYKGREIKTIGDSFMTAFKSVEKALDYAMALQANTGHSQVQVRAGIHIGPMQVEENDVFGGAVNFAARVISAIEEREEIWLSDRAKEDLDRAGAKQHALLKWERHDGVKMKGFGSFTLWSLKD